MYPRHTFTSSSLTDVYSGFGGGNENANALAMWVKLPRNGFNFEI